MNIRDHILQGIKDESSKDNLHEFWNEFTVLLQEILNSSLNYKKDKKSKYVKIIEVKLKSLVQIINSYDYDKINNSLEQLLLNYFNPHFTSFVKLYNAFNEKLLSNIKNDELEKNEIIDKMLYAINRFADSIRIKDQGDFDKGIETILSSFANLVKDLLDQNPRIIFSITNEVSNFYKKNQNYFQGSYSQEGEDLILWRLLKGKSPGFFLDVGAHHPVRFSNTYKLYQRGWRGINIEARPGSKKEFDAIRPEDINLEIAVSTSPEIKSVDYYMFPESAYNSTNPDKIDDLLMENYGEANNHSIIKVNAAMLNDILLNYRSSFERINLLNIDIELNDFKVLRTFDFSEYKPDIVVVEQKGLDPEKLSNDDAWRFLSSLGYKLRSYLYNSAIYLRKKEL